MYIFFMNINFLLILLFFVKLCSSQSLLALMKRDPSISKFYNMINNNPNAANLLNREYLVVLVPSDNAYLYAPDINKYIFQSRKSDFNLVVGLVSAWTSYKSINTRTGMVYTISNVAGDVPFYITNATSPSPIINGAMVIAADKTVGTQVYHVIDQMLPDAYILEFSTLMKHNTSFSQSNQKWKSLQDASTNLKLVNTSYRNDLLIFSVDKPGTILVPTNEAWNALSSEDSTKLADPLQLVQVMARLYIPNRVMFLRNDTQRFRAGFSKDPAIDDSNNIDGMYFRSSQSGMINVQGYVTTVITPNIVFTGGVIHIISSTMAVAETRNSYLQRRAAAFFNAVNGDKDLTNALKAGNITVLAVNDASMAVINQFDPATRKELLMNCIIPNIVTMANSNNVYLSAGNGTLIRIKVVPPRIYVDTVASMAEKTFLNRAIITNADDTVDGVNINIIQGTIGAIQFNCTDMLAVLERSGYRSLITNLGVTLNLGSPYTIFAPSDLSLGSMIGVNLNNTYSSTTTTTPSIATSSASTTSSNSSSSTTSSSSSTGIITSTRGNTAPSANTGNTAYQRYLLQRMIIANTLVLPLRSTGQFKAATMNYAAMQEMIDVAIDKDSQVTIGINGVMVPGPAIDDGFYCQANEATVPNGRNLIYPTNTVLITSTDATTSICVVAPCVGSMVTYAAVLLLCMHCLVYRYLHDVL